jgi:hypothetical protein
MMKRKGYHLGLFAQLALASTATQSRDTTLKLPFEPVVAAGIASGKLDGAIRFHLSGAGPSGGEVLRADAVTNKKTNAFGKSDVEACEWALLSALITLQEAAKAAGANEANNIVSYYRKRESRDALNFECHAGGVVAGVALKADLVKY